MKSLLLATAATVALGVASVTVANAADPPKPEMATGNTDRGPRSSVAAENPDQIRARDIIGADLVDPGGNTLGRIADMLISRNQSAVALLRVDPSGPNAGKANPVVPWSSVRFQGKPTPRFVTDLGKDDLKNGAAPPTGEAQGSRDQYVAVKQDLLGKTAVDQDGKSVGAVNDLVVSLSDGHIGAALVGGGLGMGKTGAPRAVPWDKAKLTEDKGKGAALQVAMTKQQIDQEPAFITMGPEERGSGSSTPRTGQPAGTEPTANFGSSYTKAPATRR